MAHDSNQAAHKRTLWRTGVIGHPDYRLPEPLKPCTETEKKPLFPVKIRCSRNFTLRKKSPNSNLLLSPGIQLQSFSKLQLSPERESRIKSRSISASAYHSSQLSLNLSENEATTSEATNAKEKRRAFLMRPHSCVADIDVSVTNNQREYPESPSWIEQRTLDNSDGPSNKEALKDVGNEKEQERQASLRLIRDSLNAAFEPIHRQMSDDQVFEEVSQKAGEQGVTSKGRYKTLESAIIHPTSTSPFGSNEADETKRVTLLAKEPDSILNKPVVRSRTKGPLGVRAVSAVYDSLPSSPLFNPGETWRYRDASTQCQVEEVLAITNNPAGEKKAELRRRRYGRAFRQKRAATIAGNSEQSQGERKRKPLLFSRSQSECGSTVGVDQVPHSYSFRHFRERKSNQLHFPDYLLASMTLLPEFRNFLQDNSRCLECLFFCCKSQE